MKAASILLCFCVSIFFPPGKSFGGAVSFDLSKTNGTLQPRNLAGTCLPIWNSANTFNLIKKGLSQSNYRLFRFPNGTLSNGYHWNGAGLYTSDSIWGCDSQTFSPGFMSMTLNRGTSVSNWGFQGCSNITDGDTSTSWRSDELISGSLPYFYLELPQTAIIDSIVILWGEKYAVDFDIDFFSLLSCPYPGPFKYKTDEWENQKRITNNDQFVYTSSLPGDRAQKYVRVLIKKFKDQEKSVQVKEVFLFSQGVQLSKNKKRYSGGSADDQTRVIAMPSFIGSKIRPTSDGSAWNFELFMDYIRSISDSVVPVISVNYGTGSPEEAAAWVHYANVKKQYNIRFWQIGNELDGEWEDGGPITSRMYAEKYLLFAKAMKQQDSTIKIFGPLLSNAQFNDKNSGLFDGKSWMQEFIDIIGQQEKTDGVKYCDGVDFHSYPYWAYSPNATGLLEKIDFIYEQSDSLKVWINASLVDPDSVFVMLSEYNSSTVLSDLLQKPINGIFVANMYAGLAEKFGGRAMSVFWDSYESGDNGPDGTFGSLSLFNSLDNWHFSSLKKAPSASYWALFVVQNMWIDPAKENSVVPAMSDPNRNIRAYGLKTPGDFRALFFNVSFTPETLSCSLSTGNFSKADVFTWGESQFKWIGSDYRAFAYPNCGPVSKSFLSDDLKEIIIPGLSMCVIRYHNSDSTGLQPRFLHLWAFNYAGTTKVLPVCGTVYSGTDIISGIDYTIDSAAATPRPLRLLDSGLDGPCESFFDSISLTGLKPGQHQLYVQAKTGSGAVSIDSIVFFTTGSSIKQPVFMNNTEVWNISKKIFGNRIVLAFNPLLRNNDKTPISGRVISANGSCIKEIACKSKGTSSIEWAGETATNRKAAPGVYYLVVSSGGKVIYRTKMVIGK